ncbi:hypothetical protein GVAV_001325 [Gurleya vavrai]
MKSDFYSIEVLDEKKRKIKMEKFKGKVLLIVNVATKCGLAKKTYNHLSVLLDKYHNRGLEILLFPCNDFLSQEPGTLKEIREMIDEFNPDFKLFDKINVIGSKIHPLYSHLINNYDNPWCFKFIKWNFTKFLIGRNGEIIERYGPTNCLEKDKKLEKLFEIDEDLTIRPL